MSKLNKYIKQTGGGSIPEVILEKGEYFKDINNKVHKVSSKAPSHDEGYIIKDQVEKTTKGKGGVLVQGVQSVLSNTFNNRKVSDESFGIVDAQITLSKDEITEMSDKIGLKLKPKKMSGSKFIDEALKSKNKFLNKFKNKEYRKDDLISINTLKANKTLIDSLPTVENLYDLAFEKQENDKSNITVNSELAQEGYKGVLNRYPTMNGTTPVARTKDNNKPIRTLNSRTISMDDVFPPDSVEVKNGKATTFYNSRLKKYIK